MSIITSLARTWLTGTFKPFVFKNEYDQLLPYAECENLGLYVHIPFCKSICNFCPYCKVKYDEDICNKYIDSLIKEIHLVGGQKEGRKEVTSLYFGGGTPALAIDRIKEIIDAINEHFVITDGIGIELHPDNVKVEILEKLKDAGITKISIGIQSFLNKYQKILSRQQFCASKMEKVLSQVPFETVSMDFIFALPGQTFDDLKTDVDKAISIGANHVAIYPFIDFTFTDSSVKTMPKRTKRKLLDDITNYCLDKGFKRKSIWTFSSEPEANYSSMTRDNFIGFGCSATSLFKNQFKINTFDVKSYCERINSGSLATSVTTRFIKKQRMVYWLFWTAYSTSVRSSDFEKFFGKPLEKVYGFELFAAKLLGFITEESGTYKMTLKGAFYYHYFESFYTLSYIDKMWGIMRKEAFPKRIEL